MTLPFMPRKLTVAEHRYRTLRKASVRPRRRQCAVLNPMAARRGTAATAALIACAVAVSACGSSQDSKVSSPAASPTPERADFPAASSYQSPEQATLSWFYAINHKDKAAAVAHFEAAAAGQMNWGNGDTSTWPTFSALHCKPTSHSATTAYVNCTFSESQAPSVGNPDSFWTVELQRQPDGRWLISSYGQG
jgi:hypothetical protein